MMRVLIIIALSLLPLAARAQQIGGGGGSSTIGNGTQGDYSGTIQATHFTSGTSAGVSCAAGSVSLVTFTITNGIVTHC